MKKNIKYLLLFLSLFIIYSCSEDDNPVNFGDATLNTQEADAALQYLNAVRANPSAYSSSIGVDLSSVSARPALLQNSILTKVAQERAADMAVRDYVGHVNPDGKACNILIYEAGYTIPSAWYSDPELNYFESLAANSISITGQDFINMLIVDEGVPSLGHRNHLLGIGDFNSTLVDVGIGYATNPKSTYINYFVVIIAKHE